MNKTTSQPNQPSKMDSKAPQILKFGILAKGKKELTRYLRGEKITCKEAVLAKCYDCMYGYTDGKVDCQVRSCPNYHFMPYKGDLL